MIVNKYFLLLNVFLLTSCSLILESFDQDILEKHDVTPLSKITKTRCIEKQENILISENKEAQNSFNQFIKKIEPKYKIKFIDEVVLWSLIQMNLRPDLSSPSAKLQVLIRIDGKEEYINSFSESEGNYPFLKGLEKLLQKYNSKYSLYFLSNIIDKNFRGNLYVSNELETFLTKNREMIIKNPRLKKVFIRGDETLKENERIPKLVLGKLIKLYKKGIKNAQYKHTNFLFSYNDNSPITPNCNFDMNLYNDSLFLINDKKIESHIFGLKNKKNSFLAVSSQDYKEFKTIENTFLFKGKSNIRSASICSFKNKLKKRNTLWLVSTESRDPGQHLFHLLQYGIESINNVDDLTTMLRFSRHQFLKDPVRLIIESRKSSENQLNELLKLNIPIYNSKKLGKVWGYYHGTKESTFILDDRRQGHLECTSH